jgi:alginate O-acetyltransferase complex protein AlgI
MEVMVIVLAAEVLSFKILSLPRRRALPFLLMWPGMDPRPWEVERRSDPAAARLIGEGLAAMGVGAVIAAGVPQVPLPARPWLVIFAALAMVHVGFFDILAGAWRAAGRPVERICPAPWRSRSLAEFWGARWNLAFHVVARDRVFRPLARRIGRAGALAATFLFSGILHELAISLPAGGGWGSPTLYFMIHGLAVMGERRTGRKAGRLATAALVLLPLPLLFHGPFRTEVILPWVS